MARCLRLDDQDRTALRKLDDFVFSSDGETARVAGEMEVEVVRLTSDDGSRLCLTITFPNNETLDVRFARAQLFEQLEIEADES